ncbi:MAG TPA: endolytic transglycosylase MltG [Acidimicrobiales bacterium]|nr:endolytic transglycosylase MltG [Acidimicrobiales bacterium]
MTTRGRRARRRRRIVVGLVSVAAVVAVVCLAAFGWYRTQLQAGGGPRTKVVVEIPQGSSTADIAGQLEDAAVIRNATAFTWHARFSGAGPFDAGRYRFTKSSSADTALEVLARGSIGPEITTVTIPEGFRLAQIEQRIHERIPRFTVDDIDTALTGGDVTSSLLPQGSDDYEGLLFPATYSVTPDDSVSDLLQEMADGMVARVDGLKVDADVAALGLSDHQLVVVASLVQAEAGNPDEAAKIARVIYNRLAAGEPLGIDATSRYLSIISGEPVDFESASPYNTRRRPGLPPTPIGAPGQFALDAAAHPAPGDWMWYVRSVTNDAEGRPQHTFTNSAEEFARAKQACHDAGLGCGAP